MKHLFQNLLDYSMFLLYSGISILLGIEKAKKVGYCFIKKYEDNCCVNCEKTNVFRQVKGRNIIF